MSIFNSEPQHSPTGIIAGFFTFIALCFFVLIWLDQQERFPELETGYYVGSIKGISANEQYIFLHKLAGTEGRLILVGQETESVKVTFEAIPYYEKKCCKSLNVKTKKLDLMFYGVFDKGAAAGRVFDKETNKTGSWKLTQSVNESQDSKNAKLIKDYLSYDELRVKLAYYTNRVADQKLQINSLQAILHEKQKLKGTASAKLKIETDALAKTKESFEKQQLVVDKLRKQVELGQKITPVGRLAAISRETLIKDRLWLSGKLNYYPVSGDIVIRSRKVNQIIALQQEIEKFRISKKNGEKN